MQKRTDPSGLRAAMIAAAAQFEAKAEALRAAANAINGDEPALPQELARRSFERHPDLAREAIVGYVGDEWIGAADITRYVSSKHPELSRGAIAGALRRLADQGALERDDSNPRRLMYRRARPRHKPTPPSRRPRA